MTEGLVVNEPDRPAREEKLVYDSPALFCYGTLASLTATLGGTKGDPDVVNAGTTP